MRKSSRQSQIAIDASALVELLLRTPIGRSIAQIVASAGLIAPDVINPETMQTLRNLERAGKITPERADRAVMRLIESAITRVPTTGLIADAWPMRTNLSAYDASYMALAKGLDCPLLTIDVKMMGAPSFGVTFLSVQ